MASLAVLTKPVDTLRSTPAMVKLLRPAQVTFWVEIGREKLGALAVIPDLFR